VTTSEPGSFRSRRWFEGETLRTAIHHSRAKQMGYAREEYDGKPVIAILNTWSDINPCHGHFRQRADEVKRGIWQAGGFPVELPVMSLSEPFQKPSTMLYRNLLAMQAEEELRSHPIDGAVLMGGCDKTTPALIMGRARSTCRSSSCPPGRCSRATGGVRRWAAAATCGGTGPTSVPVAWDPRSGTRSARAWRARRTLHDDGHGLDDDRRRRGARPDPSRGLVDPRGRRRARTHGRPVRRGGGRARGRDIRVSSLLTAGAFRNALVTVMALGGSTNALIHLIAMAARADVALDLDAFDEVSRQGPAAGQPATDGRIPDGGLRPRRWAARRPGAGARPPRPRPADRQRAHPRREPRGRRGLRRSKVIRTVDDPVRADGGLAVLRGNLAPDGAVIKHGAASPDFLEHRGPAVVFDDYDDMVARIDDPDLEVTADSVLVLRNAGPVGGPGMPEWGMLPIPKKLLAEGVRDMVRISDARMSGTSYGTCVLHVAPESAVGGPLALLRDGDEIVLDVEARRLDVAVPDEELDRRRSEWVAPDPPYVRGYGRLYADHIQQADRGCDFDFLEGTAPTREPEIH
jgi:dihydroxyacid dehydratase/phosphogluconate dehydratase